VGRSCSIPSTDSASFLIKLECLGSQWVLFGSVPLPGSLLKPRQVRVGSKVLVEHVQLMGLALHPGRTSFLRGSERSFFNLLILITNLLAGADPSTLNFSLTSSTVQLLELEVPDNKIIQMLNLLKGCYYEIQYVQIHKITERLSNFIMHSTKVNYRFHLIIAIF